MCRTNPTSITISMAAETSMGGILEDMRPTSVVAVKKEHTPTAALGVASSNADGL
jgi:hypothetical protein